MNEISGVFIVCRTIFRTFTGWSAIRCMVCCMWMRFLYVEYSCNICNLCRAKGPHIHLQPST